MALHTLEICTGVGMLGEGLRAGLRYLGIETRTVCHIEREAYPASVLASRMQEGSLDAAPIWSDLLTFNARAWDGAVDCIVAGFPCQDLSVAGKRVGLDGKRSGLFFDILDIADDCGAQWLFLENVAGIASATSSVVDETEGELEERAASRVLGELAERGWDAEWLTLSASAVGASHGRARWFCFAWRVGNSGCLQRRARHEQNRPKSSEAGKHQAHRWHSDTSRELGNTQHDGQPTQPQLRSDEAAGHDGGTQESPAPGESARASRSDDVPSVHGGASRSEQLAYTGSAGLQGREQRGALHQHGDGAHAHESTEQLCSPLFSPGPNSPEWPGIIRDFPWLVPALSIEGQEDAKAAFSASESVLHGELDGLAAGLDFDTRAQRLKCCGNGVVALQAATAFVQLFHQARGIAA